MRERIEESEGERGVRFSRRTVVDNTRGNECLLARALPFITCADTVSTWLRPGVLPPGIFCRCDRLVFSWHSPLYRGTNAACSRFFFLRTFPARRLRGLVVHEGRTARHTDSEREARGQVLAAVRPLRHSRNPPPLGKSVDGPSQNHLSEPLPRYALPHSCTPPAESFPARRTAASLCAYHGRDDAAPRGGGRPGPPSVRCRT